MSIFEHESELGFENFGFCLAVRKPRPRVSWRGKAANCTPHRAETVRGTARRPLSRWERPRGLPGERCAGPGVVCEEP